MTPEEMLNRRINKLEALVMPPITLRDWFAGKALARLVPSYHPEGAAIAAYQYADAMLAQREKQP